MDLAWPPTPMPSGSQSSLELANTCFHTHLKEPSFNHGLKLSVALRMPLISEKPYSYSPLLKPLHTGFVILLPQDSLLQSKVQIIQTSLALQGPFDALS